MSNPVEWNLAIALKLISSLKEFVDLTFADTDWPFLSNALRDCNTIYEQNNHYKSSLIKKLDKVLAKNRWTISFKENDLKNLPEQGRLRCSGDEILIIKNKLEANNSAVVKDACYCYFLVAALSGNGKILCNWKDGSWNEIRLDYYTYSYSEPYYFYYCKVTPQIFVKFLRLEDISKVHTHRALRGLWSFTKTIENLFEYHEYSRSNFDEETKIQIERENNEIIEKLNKDKNEDKTTIESLKKRIEELEIDISGYEESIASYQKNEKILKESNELLEKSRVSLEIEKEKLIQTIKEKDKEIERSRIVKRDNAQVITQLEQNLEGLKCKINELEAENSRLKNSILETENTKQNLIKANSELCNNNQILQENCKNFEEELNKINNSQQIFSQENLIIRLLPNRKHGLPNFGNTCYLNSLLQVFASSPLFVKKIKNTKTPFCSSLSTLLAEMHNENSSKTIANLIQNFRENLMETYQNIEAYTQQDVKEVFNMILSKIDEDGEPLDLFSIGLHQEFTCRRRYQHKSQYNDIQNFLIIPSSHKNSIVYYLQNLWYYHSSKQKLICNDCGEEVDMNIELKTIDWPVYLVLYFPTPPDNISEKLYIDQKYYYIYGAICYYQDQGCFHYTAFTSDENEWNEYNDEHVETRKLDPHVVHLTFYSRKEGLCKQYE